jgi:hypothetical protein
MQTAHLIKADVFCTHYNAEFTFIHSLHQSGLIEIVTIDETPFIQEDDLQKLEKIVRMHYDLHINVEGIETIINLLNRLENMQQEMAALRNRLGIYEV